MAIHDFITKECVTMLPLLKQVTCFAGLRMNSFAVVKNKSPYVEIFDFIKEIPRGISNSETYGRAVNHSGPVCFRFFGPLMHLKSPTNK